MTIKAVNNIIIFHLATIITAYIIYSKLQKGAR